MSSAPIADAGEVELAGTSDDAKAAPPAFALQVFQHLRRGAAVVEQDDLQTAKGAAAQAAEAAAQQAEPVFEGDEDADFGGGEDLSASFAIERRSCGTAPHPRPLSPRGRGEREASQRAEPAEDDPGARILDVVQFCLQALSAIPLRSVALIQVMNELAAGGGDEGIGRHESFHHFSTNRAIAFAIFLPARNGSLYNGSAQNLPQKFFGKRL